MPNTSVTKVVEIRNTGKSDAWVRVRIDKCISLNSGSDGDTGLISLNINEGSWIDGNDGYYYYSKKLSEDEYTEPVFTKVDFSKDMDNAYVGAVCSVNVYAEAVQYANNGDDVLSAAGWPDEGDWEEEYE